MKYFLTTSLLFTIIVASCNKTDETPDPQSTGCTSSFSSNVLPIVQSKCAISGCHDGNGNIVNLNSYTALKTRADNGRLQEFLFDKGIMPPQTATQLTDEEKDFIKCWLDNDAQEN